MERQITLTLSDAAFKRAAGLASVVSRPLEDVLAETLEVALPDLGGSAMLPPIASLSDQEVLALAHTRMESQQSARLSELLDRQQAGILTEEERTELYGLFQIYLRLWLRQSEAMAEAASRGLREPLPV